MEAVCPVCVVENVVRVADMNRQSPLWWIPQSIFLVRQVFRLRKSSYRKAVVMNQIQARAHLSV
jgi:hypothetical protein